MDSNHSAALGPDHDHCTSVRCISMDKHCAMCGYNDQNVKLARTVQKKTRDTEKTHEVLQQVAIVALRHLGVFPTLEQAIAFCFRTASKILLGGIDRRKSVTVVPFDPDVHEGNGEESYVDAAHRVEQTEEFRRIRESCRAHLSKGQFQVVDLHYFHGLSIAETALRLDISRPTTDKRLSRAIKVLRNAPQEDFKLFGADG